MRDYPYPALLAPTLPHRTQNLALLSKLMIDIRFQHPRKCGAHSRTLLDQSSGQESPRTCRAYIKKIPLHKSSFIALAILILLYTKDAVIDSPLISFIRWIYNLSATAPRQPN